MVRLPIADAAVLAIGIAQKNKKKLNK